MTAPVSAPQVDSMPIPPPNPAARLAPVGLLSSTRSFSWSSSSASSSVSMVIVCWRTPGSNVIVPLAAVKLGLHDPDDFRSADLVVVNPAVRPDHPLLALARESGLGTNLLEEIRRVGADIREVRYPFRSAG